jgi:hypothetical protein
LTLLKEIFVIYSEDQVQLIDTFRLQNAEILNIKVGDTWWLPIHPKASMKRFFIAGWTSSWRRPREDMWTYKLLFTMNHSFFDEMTITLNPI